MLVYHGTSDRYARQILQEGLLPRAQSKFKGNWGHTVQSSPLYVYLTAAYSGYFAASALRDDSERWLLVEVDLDRVPEGNLHPDEDFLAQVTTEEAFREQVWQVQPRLRNQPSATLVGKSKWFREFLSGYQHHWKDSLEGLGNCCHLGTVPREAITRVVAYEPSSNPAITMAVLDPTISTLNYRFCGEKYRGLTQWLMGREVSSAQVSMELPFPLQRDAHAHWREVLVNRAGLEVLYGEGE